MKVIDAANGMFSGKFKGMIFYVRNGKTFVRRASEPEDGEERDRTEAQRRQNERFRRAQLMYRDFRRLVSKDVWTLAGRAVGRMAHALFISENCACFDGEGMLVDFRNFRFTEGELRLPRRMAVEAEGGGWFRVTWEEEREQPTAAGTDRLMAGAIYDPSPLGPRRAEEVAGTRGEGGGRFRLNPEFGLAAHAYLYFARADGTAYSPSEYFRVELE